ncbi:MAG TPA: transcriptional regulator [Sandaracinaceae bacterium LLY-WYZ-13_1]|nr:transcriptional regulator [Sandaracinaceae bacterium LLY-WYZ-13_1]
MPEDPPSRASTARERLAEELKRGFASVKTLAHRSGLTEGRVREHLRRLAASPEGRGELERQEPTCRRCGHVVEAPDPFAMPGRCPRCHSDHVEPPRFRIV